MLSGTKIKMGGVVTATLETEGGNLLEVRGLTLGTFVFGIQCPPGEEPCATGEIQATLTLEDAQQNRSAPFPFGYTAVEP